MHVLGLDLALISANKQEAELCCFQHSWKMLQPTKGVLRKAEDRGRGVKTSVLVSVQPLWLPFMHVNIL